MAKPTSNVPAVTEEKKESLPALPPEAAFEAFAGAGLENVGAKDLLIPRLAILQALSPQVDKKAAEYVPGAEVGMICDVALGELFPEGVVFLPVQFTKVVIEWAPRSSGKGLVEIHTDLSILDEGARNEKNQLFLPNGNYLSETAQYFGFNLSAGARKSFIPMASTQLKKSRLWNTLASGEEVKRQDGSVYTPPLFYRTYHLTSIQEENTEGKWQGWKITRAAALPEIKEIHGRAVDWVHLLEEAKKFREMLIAGEAKADMSTVDMTAETGGGSGKEGAM